MDAVVGAFMTAHGVPGLSLAIARNGEMAYAKGYGFADRSSGEKVKPSSLFRIASVSKPITSVALFTLIEQGRLNLGDFVFGPGGVLRNDYGRTPYRRYVEQIRLHHLMTHTCGGWQNDGTDPMFQDPRLDQRELITWTVANRPLTHAPGEQYAYSNFGYCVLGRVIEKVTGQPYADYVNENVLKRCGISGMRIGGNTLVDRVSGEVVYYGADGQDPYDMNVSRMDSHGGWLAAATHLVRFATHVDGLSSRRDILRLDSIRQMTTPTPANSHYAKGWAVNNAPIWWHNGSLPGTTSVMLRTASGFCWAALANYREISVNTGDALDKMMWDLVGQVKGWQA